jgi:sugar/nucleoside kinase (ribokinase family)
MSLSFEEEAIMLQTKWTAKAIREAKEAGLTYSFDPNTDPDWSEKLDKLHSGEFVVKNGELVPAESVIK